MFENDFPLLSTPTLMALILHDPESGPVTLDDCVNRLAMLFIQARETPALPPEAIRQRLADHLRQLQIAGVLEPAAEGGYCVTDRGRKAIQRAPEGIDLADLMEYPEFAAHIRASSHISAGMDPRVESYDKGYKDRRESRPFTDNPYSIGTVDHISWENGWMEALDEER